MRPGRCRPGCDIGKAARDPVNEMNFADRLFEAQRQKESIVILGIDPQLDGMEPGLPPGFTVERFCCEVVEACAASIVAIKPQLAFFEARGVEGMRAFVTVVKLAHKL